MTSESGEHRSAAAPDSRSGSEPSSTSIVTLNFSAGDRVADRYRIVRFLAEGGGGEVYEAEDTALGTHVALKTLRAVDRDLDDPEPAVRRFKREINLARQVTHPNVCRIYDLGQHRKEDGELVLFLTMELLLGETLRDRIRREGKLSLGDALPIAQHIADALEAARAAGVVHRDLKSANVILVPSDHEAAGFRAVVTDFGLARFEREAETGTTRAGRVVGTPEYMAPEQLEGGNVTAAADIYAFGMVLFEMVTGHLPFAGSSPLVTALQRLREDPSSPRIYVPDLEPRWEGTILRCLKREPEARFGSAEDVVRSLRGLEAGSKTTRLWPRWVAGLALTASVGFVGWLLSGGPANVAEAAFQPRKSVALVGVYNLSHKPEHAWLSSALTEMLATEAAAGGRLRVIPGADVARARLELGVEDDDLHGGDLPRSTLEGFARLLGTDLLVRGGYTVVGEGSLRLDLRVEDPSNGEVLARFSRRGTEAGILDLVESAGADLRANLGVSETAPSALRAAFPEDDQARRLYTEGLHLLRHEDIGQALEMLKGAVQLDPDQPKVQSTLASAWASAGHRPKAQHVARNALSALERIAGTDHDLPERDRRWVEAQSLGQLGEHRRANEIWAELAREFPDDLELGLRLADSQVSSGEPSEALETVARLRNLPRGDDPRLHLAEAEAARAVSGYEQQMAAAERALAAARDIGATLLAARANEVIAGAARDLGQPERGLMLYNQAIAAYREAGLRGPVARAQVAQAKILRQTGRFDEAKPLLDQALVVAEEIGDLGTQKHAYNTLAIIHRQQGRLSAAKAIHKLELRANEETGDRRGVQITRTSLGVVHRRLGELDDAEESFRVALDMAREEGNRRGEEINLNLLGEVLLRRGRLDEARTRFESALEVNENTGSPRGRAYYLSSLGEVALLQGDLDLARRRHQEALDIRVGIQEATNVAYSQVSLALVALTASDAHEAERLALAAAEEFEAEDKPDAEALARALVARAKAQQGESSAAAREIARARELSQITDENVSYLLGIDLHSARVYAALGRVEEALELLRSVSEKASDWGLVDSRLEADVLSARLRLRQGTEDAAARWKEVEEEARSMGFLGLIR
ncbi:MAG: tetratricopeptide repeat protein [Thermoanaerobaculia bacterium]|nr:tetratricopeptide repeat protein [Thermoanaerobaculia bacterium]